MALVRIYPAGWGVGEKLTSAQMNALDLDHINAADKRAGQSDTIEAVWSASGAGRLIGTYAAGADADTTYLVSGANAIIDTPTLTADRAYTLSNTNAIAGDRIMVLNRSGFYLTVKNAGGATLILLGDSALSGESMWADFLFTGAAWVRFKSSVPSKNNAPETFTASSAGAYVPQRGVYTALVLLCGGGGGGGGARAGDTSDNHLGVGGAGGGGARYLAQFVSVTPLDPYDVNIGGGGNGGVGGAFGTVGGDTTLTTSGGGTTLATGRGAGAGCGSANLATSATSYQLTMGGPPDRKMVRGWQLGAGLPNPAGIISWDSGTVNVGAAVWSPPGTGGMGVNYVSSNSSHGGPGFAGEGPTPFDGGTFGDVGAVVGSKYGGGGGGGGGGGPFGVGAAGGSGGNGHATTGLAGAAGSSAAANTGAGGGGAGGGGCAGTTPGAAANGGNGGSGKMIIIPIR